MGVNAKRKFMKDANGHWSNSAAIITAAVCHAKNQHVRILQTIYYEVLAYRETPRANAKVVVARAAQVGMACKKESGGAPDRANLPRRGALRGTCSGLRT